jgi:hypothetical protein
MTSWKLTALMVLGVVVAMSGVVLFVAIADDDYRFAIDKTLDEPPRDVVSIMPYEALSPKQQQYFDQARQGNPPHFEETNRMPRVVEVDGTYYYSKAPRYYDWLNPRTFGPTLTFFVGGAIAIKAVRLDISSQITT